MPAITPDTLVANRYTLESAVPDRGLGETWRSRDGQREGAPMQLKFLRAVAGDEMPPDALKVIRALRALRHPVIPSVVNQGVHAGRPWIAFDDLTGDSLGTRLDRARSRGELLDLALLRSVFDGVAAALTAAHNAPVPLLHGALTPGSVIVLARPARGAAGALLDLGLAPWLDAPTDLAARSARALITPAPELARGGRPSVQSDVFSLGALLTELLATPPSPGQTMMAVSAARRRGDVPSGVWFVLEKSMLLRPEERFPTVDALAAAVGRAWSEVPTSISSGEPPASSPTDASARSSLLGTFSSEVAPPSFATPPVAVAAPMAPLLGAMPVLSPPVPSSPPPGWENPWSTLALQAKLPTSVFEPVEPEPTLLEVRVPDAPPAPDPGSTFTMDVSSMPWARGLDPTASPDATLLAGPSPRVSSPDGTLMAESPLAFRRPEPPPSVPSPWVAPPAPLGSPPARAKAPTIPLVVGVVLLLISVAAVAYYAGS